MGIYKERRNGFEMIGQSGLAGLKEGQVWTVLRRRDRIWDAEGSEGRVTQGGIPGTEHCTSTGNSA